MDSYWNLFQDTGDPLAWLLYRSQQAPSTREVGVPPTPDKKEAAPWQQRPIS